jgi:hypothetical protein
MTETVRLASLTTFAMLVAVLAALSAGPASAQARAYDGLWRIEQTSATCRRKIGSFSIRIADGTVRGRGIAGTISAFGDVRWSSAAELDGATVIWEGRFSANTGRGTFERSDGKCRGSFMARRR